MILSLRIVVDASWTVMSAWRNVVLRRVWPLKEKIIKVVISPYMKCLNLFKG